MVLNLYNKVEISENNFPFNDAYFTHDYNMYL